MSTLAWRLKSPVILGYAIAFLSVAMAVVGALVFDRVLRVDPSVSLFLCAVTFVAWASGTAPALFATTLSILAFDYFFLQPVHSFVLQLKDIPPLALFTVAALFVVSLSAAQRRAADSLRSARDEQQVTVRELKKLNETLGTENAERRRAEENARLTEEGLRAIIDTIPVMVARRGADGVIDFVNQTWRTYTGLSQENPKGLEVAAFHPDDRPQFEQQWLLHLASKGDTFETEYRMRRADGEYRWHFIRRVPLRDGNGDAIAWYGVGTDIEDRKRAASALQRSEAYLAEAQKLSRTGSFVWEFDTGEYFWSDETYRILGVDRSVKPSIALFIERVHPDDRAILNREINRAANGVQNQDYQLRLLLPNGEIKALHVIAHYVKYESGREETVGALMDITETQKSQEALDSAQAALTHASRVATLGELSASIAHEVNQPLAAIVASGEAGLRWLARPEPDVEEVRELTKRVVADARRASEIINRIRAMAARREPERTLLSLDDVIREALLFLRHEVQSRGVTVSHSPELAAPMVLADRTQLQQVIVNLVVNAMQAIAQPGYANRNIVVRTVALDPATLRCTVEDSGPGIEPQHLPRLFESFFTTKDGGMGIGLPICRSVVEAYGGRITADNESAHGGARFSFTLPVADTTT